MWKLQKWINEVNNNQTQCCSSMECSEWTGSDRKDPLYLNNENCELHFGRILLIHQCFLSRDKILALCDLFVNRNRQQKRIAVWRPEENNNNRCLILCNLAFDCVQQIYRFTVHSLQQEHFTAIISRFFYSNKCSFLHTMSWAQS